MKTCFRLAAAPRAWWPAWGQGTVAGPWLPWTGPGAGLRDLSGGSVGSTSVIRGVIFDYGGVLSLEPTAEALARLHALCEIDAEVFAGAWLEHRHGYDLGELSAADYWALVTGRRYGEELLARVVAADVDSWAETNPAMIGWIRALKEAGLRVGVLSNMPREHWLDYERRHDWLALCDHVTVSWERGTSSPTRGSTSIRSPGSASSRTRPCSSTTARTTSRRRSRSASTASCSPESTACAASSAVASATRCRCRLLEWRSGKPRRGARAEPHAPDGGCRPARRPSRRGACGERPRGLRQDSRLPQGQGADAGADPARRQGAPLPGGRREPHQRLVLERRDPRTASPGVQS